MVEAVEEVMKDGRKAIRGKCPDCGEGITKILGSSASSPPSSDP